MLTTVIQNHQRQISGGKVSLKDLKKERNECTDRLGDDISMKERRNLELLSETLTELIQLHITYQLT